MNETGLVPRPDCRPFLPSPAQSKIGGPTARAHAKARRQTPRGREFFASWENLVAAPFQRITTDGSGLYQLGPNGAPSAAMCEIAQNLLALLTPAQRAADCTPVQRRALMDLVARYIAPLPPGLRQVRIEEIERRLANTHFRWIGGSAEDSIFYYRVQSPVVPIEFDHHIGVFPTNAEPARFHVHTIVRTLNGNDDGLDLLRLHYRNAPHHRRA